MDYRPDIMRELVNRRQGHAQEMLKNEHLIKDMGHHNQSLWKSLTRKGAHLGIRVMARLTLLLSQYVEPEDLGPAARRFQHK